MKLLLVTLSCLMALASAGHDILRFYHENVGIELAARIKQSEQALDFDGARIIGGSQANLGAYPHMAGLIIDLQSGQQSVCGSSLLTNTRIVTAAHCWFDGRGQAVQFNVVLGSTQLFSGGTRVSTRNVQVHGSYTTWNLNNDIAIATINHVAYTNNIRNINLPSGSQLNNNFAGTWANAAGFGLTSDYGSPDVSDLIAHGHIQHPKICVCVASLVNWIKTGYRERMSQEYIKDLVGKEGEKEEDGNGHPATFRAIYALFHAGSMKMVPRAVAEMQQKLYDGSYALPPYIIISPSYEVKNKMY